MPKDALQVVDFGILSRLEENIAALGLFPLRRGAGFYRRTLLPTGEQ